MPHKSHTPLHSLHTHSHIIFSYICMLLVKLNNEGLNYFVMIRLLAGLLLTPAVPILWFILVWCIGFYNTKIFWIVSGKYNKL